MRTSTLIAAMALATAAAPAAAATFFSTGNPDGLMAAATRPGASGVKEIETADDFALTRSMTITGASFTGLVRNFTGGATIGQVGVEIYRVFPQDSDTLRPIDVPTRTNSPSDVAFDGRVSGADLTYTVSDLGALAAGNSVQPGGINAKPANVTGGDGAVTGDEDVFSVDFTTPFTLGPGHYFFVPQVQVTGGDFLWLSAPHPIVPPGTSFPAGFTDLQAWTRDADLAPDWLRIGTDIEDQGRTFNMTFSLTGSAIPEPDAWLLAVLGFGLAGGALRRVSRKLPA